MTQYKDIPQPTDNRNVSQADILHNFEYLINVANPAAIVGILPVDHKASADNTANPTDGFHAQVSFLNRTTPANLTNAINAQNSNGITYTKNDTAPTAPNPQLHFYNGVNDFQITPSLPIRAYANFTVTAGVATVTSSFNVTSVTRTALGQYTVVFPNAMPSANYIVSVTGSTVSTGVMCASPATGVYPTNNLILVFAKFGNTSEDPKQANFIIYGG